MVDATATARISVIIPTRNRADRLMQAIDSVRQQTLPPAEIIVIDDASDDATPVLLAGIEGAGVLGLRTDRQRGAGHARNLGIAAAAGSLLAFLDDDDRWLPDKLAVQSGVLRAAPSSVGLVCSAYHVISSRTGEVVRTWRPPEQPIDLGYFLRTTGFMTTVPLLRRECFDAVGGFDEDLSGGQDLDMWIRIAQRFEIASVPDILAEHHIHGDQITTDLPAKARASARILHKHRRHLYAYPDLLRRHLERAALLWFAAGEAEIGQDFLSEAIAMAPDREDLQQHMTRSRQNPESHAAEVLDQAFRSVDGIKLFY